MREGVLRHQYVRLDGSLRDTVIYSIVPQEWPAVKAKLAGPARRTRMNAKVTQLSIAPVKGMRLCWVDALELGPAGVLGDRAFLVVGANGELLRTGRTPALLQVAPRWDARRGVLALRFPDGSEVAEAVEPGEPAGARLYDGREVRGRLVAGAAAEALSEHLGRPSGCSRVARASAAPTTPR